jgi:hypothetical protein
MGGMPDLYSFMLGAGAIRQAALARPAACRCRAMAVGDYSASMRFLIDECLTVDLVLTAHEARRGWAAL